MSDTKVSILPEVPKSVDSAVENLTDLPTKGIGQTLADCWYLAFGGISQLAEKRRIKYSIELQKFKSELESSLNTVPEQNRQEPSSQVILKTLDEAKYCVEEEELRKLFVSLLSSSTDKTKNVHPSFAQIIGQMSPNDAKILRIFQKRQEYPICDLHIIVDEDDGSYNTISQNMFINGPQDMNLAEQMVSISSLIHLGLLSIPFGEHFYSDAQYSGFKNTAIYLNEKAKYPDNELELDKKIVRLTSLGKLFISCCITDN